MFKQRSYSIDQLAPLESVAGCFKQTNTAFGCVLSASNEHRFSRDRECCVQMRIERSVAKRRARSV